MIIISFFLTGEQGSCQRQIARGPVSSMSSEYNERFFVNMTLSHINTLVHSRILSEKRNPGRKILEQPHDHVVDLYTGKAREVVYGFGHRIRKKVQEYIIRVLVS